MPIEQLAFERGKEALSMPGELSPLVPK